MSCSTSTTRRRPGDTSDHFPQRSLVRTHETAAVRPAEYPPRRSAGNFDQPAIDMRQIFRRRGRAMIADESAASFGSFGRAVSEPAMITEPPLSCIATARCQHALAEQPRSDRCARHRRANAPAGAPASSTSPSWMRPRPAYRNRQSYWHGGLPRRSAQSHW